MKEVEECECAEAALMPNGWNYTECPFSTKPEVYQKEGLQMEFYKKLVCQCGKEVGEMQFSGREPGKWTLFEDKLSPEEKLCKFKDYIQTEIFKELTTTLQKISYIEKSIFMAAEMCTKTL